MRGKTAGRWAGLLVGLMLAPIALADVVQLPPVKDNTIFEPGGLSNGAGEHLFAGRNALGTSRRALLAFDVAGRLPPGATILDVRLTLHVSMTIVGAKQVSVHRLLADWGEEASDAEGQEGAGAGAEIGDVTWNSAFFPTVPWTTPGGDFATEASATSTVGGGGPYTWTSASMAADVQGWLDDPGTDFGWIVVGAEDSIPSAKRFDSRENGDEAVRPVLTIEFQPVAVPAVRPPGFVAMLALLAAVGLLTLLTRRSVPPS